MSFLIMKTQEEKSYRVSPHVSSNYFEATSHTHVASNLCHGHKTCSVRGPMVTSYNPL